jgi:hypothetical protein
MLQFNLSHIRSLISSRKTIREYHQTNNPVIATLRDLCGVFPDAVCPISEFQTTFQKSFLPNHISPALIS